MSRYPSPEGTSALESARDDLRACDRPPRGGIGLHLGAGPRRRHAARGARSLSDPTALYVDLEGFCLGVLGARAVQVPCGVRTQLPSLTTVEVASTVLVEDGAIVFGDTEVLVTDIVGTPRCRCWAPDVAALCGARLATLAEGRLDAARRRSRPKRSPCWSVPTRSRSTRCSEWARG